MKKADKYLSKRILCSILAAGVFGACAGAQAASLNGHTSEDKEQIFGDPKNPIVTADTVKEAGSSKFVIGQGNISVQTNGNVGEFLAQLKSNLSEPTKYQGATGMVKAVQNALAQEFYCPDDEKHYIITGLVGGEGQIDYATGNLSSIVGGLGQKYPDLMKKLQNIDTVTKIMPDNNSFKTFISTPNPEKDEHISINIGSNENTAKKSQPVIIGLIGGDLSVSALKELSIIFKDTQSQRYDDSNTSFSRTGNINIAINSGNVFGGVGSSAAVALGNIKGLASLFKGTLTVTAVTDGNSTTTVIGDVTTNISGGANVAAFANGGLAAGIGGEAKSKVQGNTYLNVASTVDGGQIEGVTIGLAGGGVALSTLDGKAASEVTSSTSITIKDGLSAGIIGGGIAAAVDASQIGDMIKYPGEINKIGDETKYSDNDNKNISADLTISGIEVTLDHINEGGKAVSTVGDTTISLEGSTTAAGIIGGGVAAATHYYVGHNENDALSIYGKSVGNSSASVSSGKHTINVNLNGITDKDKGTLVKTVTNGLQGISKIEDTQDLIDGLKTLIGTKETDGVKNKGAALGIIGGGVTAALDFAKDENGLAVSIADGYSGAQAKAKFEGADINLKNGYVVGTLGGGAAVATNFAQASSTTDKDITVNLDGAEAVGIWGNGAALFTGSSNKDPLYLDGKAKVSAQNTTININSGSADGVYGGGVAIDDSQADVANASVRTEGTSTINVSGEINPLNYNVIGYGSNPAESKDDYFNAIAHEALNVAISGGGIAAGGGAESYVAESVINVNSGAQVTGDILGGGIAVLGYENGPDNAGANVGTSTINLNQGAVIDGNVYAGGAVDNSEKVTSYNKAKATVTTATVNLNGATVSGQLAGEGLLGGAVSNSERVAVNSTLNVSGENTLALAKDKDGNAASKIVGFDNTVFAADSVTVLDKSLKAGNDTPLIDAAKADKTQGVITVADGARLDVSKLTADPANSYLVAANYDESKSTLWSDDALAYDRTEFYAAGTNAESKYSISYKNIDDLTDEELDAAASAFSAGFGRYNPQMRNIVAGYFSDKEGVKKNAPGAKAFLADAAQAASVTTAENGAASIMMLGEASGVTSNTAAISRDIADSAALRLSFTQDRVTGDNKIDADGNVWAKYVRNKHDVDGMGSSFGRIDSSSDFDGVIIGADFAKKGKAQSAVAFTYGSGNSHGGGSSNDFDMWGITLFGSIKNDDSNVIADIGFAKSSNELSGTAFGKRLTADRDITVFSAGVRAEKLYTEGSTQIVPYAGLRYMSIDPSSYVSYYDGQKAFDYDPERQNVWTLPVGVSLRHESVTGGWRLTPQADLSYVWAFGDTDNAMDVTLAGHSSRLDYTIMDSGSWLGSVALEAAKGDWSCGLGYSYQKGSHAESNKWFVNVEYSF